MDWKDRFNRHAQQFTETDFLQHVSKTVNGQVITAEQFDAIIDSIARSLEIQPGARLLDLCCGNGVVTRRLATHFHSVDAIDFSESLIKIANKHNNQPSIAYHLGSIFDLGEILQSSPSVYESICMYEALQCFSKDELTAILRTLRGFCGPNSVIFLGSVPDATRIWNFYNTPARRDEYYRRSAEGTEAIGTWWEKLTIEASAVKSGFSTEFRSQPSILHTSHYRFDVLLKPIWV